MSLSDSQKFCADRVRRLDPDRYLSTLFAPDDARAGLLALYAFNLEIATIGEGVSEILIGQMRLQWWRDTLTRMAAGTDVGHALGEALAETLRREGLPVDLLHRMIDGREVDLVENAPVNMAEVESTLDTTTANLVALALAVLNDPRARDDDLVRHAGRAMGLTGLIRMIPHDASRGRVRLPDELMRRNDVVAGKLLAGQCDAGLRRVVGEIAERAREHLHCLRKSSPAGAGRSGIAALLPVTLARVYLARLARAEYNPFAAGLEPGRLSRQIHLTRAAWRGRI
jgi:NADH dehydrogenase [ubiquinone] 1 alpha subcomplex assembly factor 6